MDPEVRIGDHLIGPDAPPFIVAEMSANHNQSLDRALQIVDAVAAAGAHALKLQTYTADTMTIDAPSPEFSIDDPASLWNGETLHRLYDKAHTPWEWHRPILARCRERGLIAFSTPFDASAVELPEVGRPIAPSPWRPVNTMTIGFGHGLAISPLQLATGVAAVVNGGIMHDATIVRPAGGGAAQRTGVRVISPETSLTMRRLMRLTVLRGTGRKAEAAGYPVGGKTGTAEKPDSKGYASEALLSSFVAAFPITEPQYVILVVLDEPRGTKETNGYATGGWVAAPAVRRIVERMGPTLGIAPIGEAAPELEELNLEPEGRKLASY